MTIYSELMSKQLESNRTAVDNLFKAEKIIAQVATIEEDLEALGAKVTFERDCVNISKNYNQKKKPDFKTIKILLDDALFSVSRFKVDVQDGNTWKYIRVTDMATGGSYSIDINMEAVKCKQVEVSRTTREIEEIKYRWECE